MASRICPVIVTGYIHGDLAELDKDTRQDKEQILADLRRSFRTLGRLSKPAQDWAAVK